MKRKRILYTLIILSIIATGAAFGYFSVYRQVQYNLGERLYLGRAYEDSARKFRALGDFKDSRNLYIRSLYRTGDRYYQSYNYLLAIRAFEELASILPGTVVLVTDAYYMMAITEGYARRYEKALELLSALKGYAKSNQLMEAARNRNHAVFVNELRNHVPPLNFQEVMRLYLDSR